MENGKINDLNQLVAQARQGYTDELIESLRPSLVRYMHSRVPNSDAEDLAHEVIAIVLAKLEQLDDNQAFMGWYLRIAGNAVSGYWRDRRGRRFVESLPNQTDNIPACQDQNTPEDIVLLNEQCAQVRQAVNMLSANEREAVLRHYWAGQGMARIGHEMERPVGTIKRWLHDAREHLKGVLE